MDALSLPLTLAAALGSGLVAGIFFAFSNFLMRALGRIDGPAGLAAMQAINRTVLNPGFLALFFGTALVAFALAVLAGLGAPPRGVAGLWLAGAAAYVVGCFGVTLVCNVPLNEALARLDPRDPAAQPQWQDYLHRWTRWNHWRTAMSVAAALAFTLAFERLPPAAPAP